MNDFLAALVSRNLGIEVGTAPATPEVQPRTPTMFEPGGAEPAPADPIDIGAPTTHTNSQHFDAPDPGIAPVTPAPTPADAPRPDPVRSRSEAPSPGTPFAAAPRKDPPRRPASDPAGQVIRPTPPPPVSLAASPVERTTPAPAAAVSPTVAPDPPTRRASEPGTLKPAAPTAPAPVAPARRSDPPLERIIRQMVLSPRPDPRDTTRQTPRMPTPEVAQTDRPQSPVIQEPAQPLRPIETRILAERDPAPPRSKPVEMLMPQPEVARPQIPPETSLAPLTSPIQVPPTPRPETVINVRIGRIEVRGPQDETRAEPPKATPRPQPSIMSLDEYLKNRSQEG